MKLDVKTMDNKAAGNITLADEVFGIAPRSDIVARVVKWQLAKRRAGTHKVKSRSEIAMTTAKMFKQKGTGHPSTDKVLDRKDQTGVVVRLYETQGQLAMWSPLTAEILWQNGELVSGFLVSALEVVSEDTG